MKERLALVVLAVIVIIALVWLYAYKLTPEPNAVSPDNSSAGSRAASIENPSRITKKTFGLYVTPSNSPVSPEKFTGYHTGVDFETTPDEANIDIPVPAICEGTLLLKKYATGYGGVAVQSCMLYGQPVTIIYGHLELASIMPGIGQQLKKGETIGILGKGYSTETDGERKHLHLGIHKGLVINILGYVQKQPELSGWLDPMQFLK